MVVLSCQVSQGWMMPGSQDLLVLSQSLPVHPSTPQQSGAIYLPHRRRVQALKAPIHPWRSKETELDGSRVKNKLTCGRAMIPGETGRRNSSTAIPAGKWEKQNGKL